MRPVVVWVSLYSGHMVGKSVALPALPPVVLQRILRPSMAGRGLQAPVLLQRHWVEAVRHLRWSRKGWLDGSDCFPGKSDSGRDIYTDVPLESSRLLVFA